MKQIVIFLLGCCIGAALSYQYGKTDTTETRPFIKLPEKIRESEVGVPLFVADITYDTITISYDPMKDRLFHVTNPGCGQYDCKANLIWVDLEAKVIYIEDTQTELVEFESEQDLLRHLASIMGDLGRGFRYGKY